MTKQDVMGLAERAVLERWSESYSSPTDAADPLPAGTLDECSTGDVTWHRIWCHDGTARKVPTEEIIARAEDDHEADPGTDIHDHVGGRASCPACLDCDSPLHGTGSPMCSEKRWFLE